MSTRTNILIEGAECDIGRTRILLYRHCEGYPADTGADILAKLTANAKRTGEPSQDWILQCSSFRRFVMAFLNDRYEQASYEKEPRAIYELTDCLSGDIEHFYVLRFDVAEGGDKLNGIWHAARRREDGELDIWMRRQTLYTPATFAALVNRDRAESNRRIAELRRAHPKNPAFNDDYPLIEVPA